jgi:hypothetical protein
LGKSVAWIGRRRAGFRLGTLRVAETEPPRGLQEPGMSETHLTVAFSCGSAYVNRRSIVENGNSGLHAADARYADRRVGLPWLAHHRALENGELVAQSD